MKAELDRKKTPRPIRSASRPVAPRAPITKASLAKCAVFNLTAEAMAVFETSGRMVDANEVAAEMWGYAREELRSLTSRDLVIPGQDVLRERCRRELEAHGVAGGEIRCGRKDGTSFSAEFRLRLLTLQDKPCVQASFRDLTERKKAEEAVRASEERYRLHFESISDIVCSTASDLRVTSISPSVVNVLGYKPEEIVGGKVGDVGMLSQDSLPKALADAEMVREGKPLRMAQHTFVTKDGSLRLLEIRLRQPKWRPYRRPERPGFGGSGRTAEGIRRLFKPDSV